MVTIWNVVESIINVVTNDGKLNPFIVRFFVFFVSIQYFILDLRIRILILQYFNFSIYPISILQIFNLSNVNSSVFQLSNLQYFKLSNFQYFNFPTCPISNASTFQFNKFSNFKILTYTSF